MQHQVKHFNSHEWVCSFEKDINDWIKENNIEIIDITYMVLCFSMLSIFIIVVYILYLSCLDCKKSSILNFLFNSFTVTFICRTLIILYKKFFNTMFSEIEIWLNQSNSFGNLMRCVFLNYYILFCRIFILKSN